MIQFNDFNDLWFTLFCLFSLSIINLKMWVIIFLTCTFFMYCIYFYLCHFISVCGIWFVFFSLEWPFDISRVLCYCLRYTEKVSMFPVGLIGKLSVSSPVLDKVRCSFLQRVFSVLTYYREDLWFLLFLFFHRVCWLG